MSQETTVPQWIKDEAKLFARELFPDWTEGVDNGTIGVGYQAAQMSYIKGAMSMVEFYQWIIVSGIPFVKEKGYGLNGEWHTTSDLYQIYHEHEKIGRNK